jgi:hypothetical protein
VGEFALVVIATRDRLFAATPSVGPEESEYLQTDARSLRISSPGTRNGGPTRSRTGAKPVDAQIAVRGAPPSGPPARKKEP